MSENTQKNKPTASFTEHAEKKHEESIEQRAKDDAEIAEREFQALHRRFTR